MFSIQHILLLTSLLLPAVAAGPSDSLVQCLTSATSIPPIFPSSVSAFDTAKLQNANQDPIDGYPAAFTTPTSSQEIANIVKCAVAANVPVVPRSGGHSYEAYSLSANGVVVDLAAFLEVSVDDASGTAKVGAGNWLGRVYKLIWDKGGYVLPGGDCPHVGVGGHVLGGGFGLLSRQLGLIVDNLVEVEMVTADGQVKTVNANTDADLFWALRGAGAGNFGIVTSFTLKLHKAPTLTMISYVWSDPASRPQVIKAFTAVTASLSNDITSTIYTSGAGATSFTAVRYGPKDGVEIALKPFLDAVPSGYTTDISEISTGYVGVIQKVWGINDVNKLLDRAALLETSRFKATSLLSNRPLSDDAVKILLDPLNANAGLQWDISLMLDSWGGAISSQDSVAATSFVHRDPNQIGYQLYTNWNDPSVSSDRKRLIEGWRTSMKDFVLSTAYQNYIDRQVGIEKYYAGGLEKLMDVKGRVDPGNLWRFGQSIPPKVSGVTPATNGGSPSSGGGAGGGSSSSSSANSNPSNAPAANIAGDSKKPSGARIGAVRGAGGFFVGFLVALLVFA
ncbi:hypothetical protein HDU97_009934 [Phlyctochytrium planicorne]|nr:hypothetical protein HDU97_009934 [Phlyctochytrium planicorne]